MDDHTCGVDGRTQARQCGSMRTPLDGRCQLALGARIGAGTNRGALLVELSRHGGMHHRVAGLPAAFTTGHSASSSLTEGMARRRARTSSDMFWLSLMCGLSKET